MIIKALVTQLFTLLLPVVLAADSARAAGTALNIVSRQQAVFTNPPRKIPSNCSTDAPLLGNGDFLAAFAGPPEELQFYLSKADLWELRVDGGPRALARLDIELPSMTGASYRVSQDFLHATTTGVFQKDGVTLTLQSAVAATENLCWVKLSAAGGEIAGVARLRPPGQVGHARPVLDNDDPVTVGREMFGGGRYYFDGGIANLVVTNAVLTGEVSARPEAPEQFDGKTTWRRLSVPKMDKTVSAAAWIKIHRTGEANYIVSKGEWNQAYSLGLSGGCLRWAVNGNFVQTAKPLETEKWQYVAGTYDGRTLRLFINGMLAASDQNDLGEDMRAGMQVVERRYENNVIRPAGAACVLRMLDGTNNGFTVSPGKPVTLVLAASGLANTQDFRADAIKRAAGVAENTLAPLRRAHEAWWSDFWSKSFVEMPDPVLEQRYYLSQYCLASASRLRHFPPGLYGWTLSEQTPMWGGAYFNNYNFFAPFYGLYAANHIEQAMPCNDAIVDAIELAREWCQDEAIHDKACANSLKIKMDTGILLPVSMLPHGITGARTTWGQRSDASYACVPLASTWYATGDTNFARRAYPFVRETAIFWENFLVFTNGRYLDLNDAALENSGRDTNPIVALALIRQVMELALDLSTTLGTDAGLRAKWRDIRNRLSDYPACTVGDLPNGSRIALPDSPATRALPIFRYSESGRAWQNDNAVGIQHIFPGNGIGLGVRPELLERARNQVEVMARWVDLNGCNSFYPAAARVGYDPQIILRHLRHWVDTSSPNGMRADNPHGMEQFSVVPCTLQEMMFQSYDGVFRFFPDWTRECGNARFGTLRARGAFLVSAEFNDGVVAGVAIASEQGRDCTIVNPWPGKAVRVIRNGRPAETLKGERFTFNTAVNEKTGLIPEE